jgi:HSP20 family protein
MRHSMSNCCETPRRGRAQHPWFAMQDVSREIDRVFGRGGRAVAPLALWETDQHINVEVDVPGLTMDQIELVLEQGKLYIRGERAQLPEGTAVSHDERAYGRFERVVRLSDNIAVDAAATNAVLKNGVLTVQLAKKPETQAQRIVIRGEGAAQAE